MCFPVVPESVIRLRAELGAAIRGGDTDEIVRTYEKLEAQERLEKAYRRTLHFAQRAISTLKG